MGDVQDRGIVNNALLAFIYYTASTLSVAYRRSHPSAQRVFVVNIICRAQESGKLSGGIYSNPRLLIPFN
jgi:hypothetical protein